MYILIFLFWILLNGKINLELIVIGLVLTTLVYLFACKFLNFSIKKDLNACKAVGCMILYLLLLIVEVIKSNWNIITLIWSHKEPDPKIAHFKVDLDSKFLRVLFANAITLTPGTITIDLDENNYTVHALRFEYIDGIENSNLLKLLKKMEGKL